jgi:hypothetical protein
MLMRVTTLSLLVLVSAPIAPACVVSADGPDVALVCVADGAACASDGDCCSNLCAPDGLCGVPVDGCAEDNVACASDADCCSELCAGDGFCGIP